MTSLTLEEAKSVVEEAVNDRLMDLSRSQWALISGILNDDTGPTLDSLKSITPKLREMASTNPWHIRGATLRKVYVFGRGVNYIKMDSPRHKAILTDPRNIDSIFGVDAYGVMNMESFCAGNFFLLRKDKRFIVVPIEQISGHSTDPDDSSTLWYIRRTWSSNGEINSIWYPTAAHKRSGEKLATQINNEKVERNGSWYLRRSNRQGGWTWGIPDSLGAMVWTEAYSAYLKDNVTLVRALSMIAWKLTNTTATGNTAAAASVRDANGSVGGAASLLQGNQLQSVGVPSAQVNMGNGQPLIAAAAATFGVPVIALLASPGETGGSYGSAATLDEPTLKTMTDIQSSYVTFYDPILKDLGAPEARIEFPSIQTDPAYRQINSINAAQQMGSLWRDESREAIMAIADIPRLHDGLPVPDGFNRWSDPEPEEDVEPNVINDPLPRQGNSGAVPGGTEQDDTNHEPDNE